MKKKPYLVVKSLFTTLSNATLWVVAISAFSSHAQSKIIKNSQIEKFLNFRKPAQNVVRARVLSPAQAYQQQQYEQQMRAQQAEAHRQHQARLQHEQQVRAQQAEAHRQHQARLQHEQQVRAQQAEAHRQHQARLQHEQQVRAQQAEAHRQHQARLQHEQQVRAQQAEAHRQHQARLHHEQQVRAQQAEAHRQHQARLQHEQQVRAQQAEVQRVQQLAIERQHLNQAQKAHQVIAQRHVPQHQAASQGNGFRFMQTRPVNEDLLYFRKDFSYPQYAGDEVTMRQSHKSVLSAYLQELKYFKTTNAHLNSDHVIKNSNPADKDYRICRNFKRFLHSGINPDMLKQGLKYYSNNYNSYKNSGDIVLGDYSMHSIIKRLFIINIDRGTVDRYQVSHGHGKASKSENAIAQGDENHDGYIDQCTNSAGRRQSMTRMGFFTTQELYFSGKHSAQEWPRFKGEGNKTFNGLKLAGKIAGVNSEARRVGLVMHGASYNNYVDIQGTMGRSMGCPAFRWEETATVLNRIKNGKLFYAFHNHKCSNFMNRAQEHVRGWESMCD